MGISRDKFHKHRLTGGRVKITRKKRKFEMGRPPAMTRLGGNRGTVVRARGGMIKRRALRLEQGQFAWASEGMARKARILNVVYNASNNELVRTNTLVKGAIVQVDAAPFKQWYAQHYNMSMGGKLDEKDMQKVSERNLKARLRTRKLDPKIEEQASAGRILARIASRPGQVGRADGYLLEGKELEFYARKVTKKK